jgi:serine/threonine-protein kinase
MGEVYRAHDPRLRRDVALKVSAERFSERFEKEARAIASLNHPNVCTLHDVGPNYLVMELVEGHTLAERIKQGAIPLDEALVIAKQIAAALEAAHEKGITHRDLKPGNIIIKPDGSVKVLDFGLAKMGGTPTAQSDNSPTLTIGSTQAGVILGTAAYMAPEQARGKEVDKRADIWAFGVVLYEMLTGQKLFQGDDLSHTLAAVIMQEPSLGGIPVRVRKLLKSCLEKDPNNRLRDIGDVWKLLEEDAPAAVAGSSAPWSRFGRLPWVAAAGLLAIVAAVGLAGWYRATRPAELKPLVRLDVDLGAGVSLGPLGGADTIISPDGTRLVYVSQLKLFTRRMDQPKAVELVGTDGAFTPFFSPDGRWVAFFSTGKLKKISVDGGAAVALCDLISVGASGSWGEDGNIIAALGTGVARSRIPSAGGAPTPVTEFAQGEVTHRWPQILPGGKAVLFTANAATGGFDAGNIEVMSLADHRRKTLVRGGTYGRYLPSGHLLYVNRGTLFAVPFDLGTLGVRGTPTPLLDDVAYSPVSGGAKFAFSGVGTFVYRSGGASLTDLLTVAWLDGAGKTQPLLAKPGDYLRPTLSPDGQRLALDMTEGSGSMDIWVYDWPRDTMTRLTFTGSTGRNWIPAWTPDGRYIVFTAPGGTSVIRSDGAGKPQPLTQSRNQQDAASFTPDGKQMAFEEVDPKTGFDLWTVSLENDGTGLRAGKPEVFLQTPANERSPYLSPDGRWLAYTSDESGTNQIYVRAFPDKGGKWQISNSGGTYPMWSRTGHELFFETLDNRIMVATYTAKSDSFVADKPRVWSETKLGGNGRNVSIAPDGRRIAALIPAAAPGAQQAQNHVIFLENFFDELHRKVPVGK